MNSLTIKILWIFAILLVLLTYFFGLFIDLTGDSGLYAAISRQMVESGDWLNLKINGEAYDQKPHLLFWLAGIGIKVFGNTNFGFKIFLFLAGISSVYFTYRLAKTLFSTETAKIAALLVVSSQAFFLYFLDIHTDTVLQTGVTLALWQLAEYFKNRKVLNFILAFTGIGLAMLTKGPVGAVIPFFAVLFYLVPKKQYRQLFHPQWIAGVLIIFLVISPTLFHLYESFGMEGLKFYFITNNFGRITGEYAGSSNDPFYYLYNILWIFIPWTLLVVVAVFFEIRNWFGKNKTNSRGFYLLGSVLAFLVVLSIAKGKAPNYFLIALSPVSVITAKWITLFPGFSIKKQNLIVKAQFIFIILFGIYTLVVLFVFSEKKLLVSIISAFLLVISIFVLIKVRSGKFQKMLLASVIVTGVLNLFLNSQVIPGFFTYQGARQALEIYQSNRDKNDILLNLHLEEYELFFYAESPVRNFTGWDDYYRLFDTPGSWIYTTRSGYEGVMEHNRNVDTVFIIRNRGMNDLNLRFLNPKTRETTLYENYLIKVR